MESLLDPSCTCEPFEALGDVAAGIRPEVLSGVRFELSREHGERTISSHFLTLCPPDAARRQPAEHLHTLLYVGEWGRAIARVDSALRGSLLATAQAFGGQLTASAKYDTEQHDAGVDLRATGFGRCVGLRWQRGGMCVLNIMNRLSDRVALGAECVLVPHRGTRVYSYGVLLTPLPSLAASLTVSQYNASALAAVRWRRDAETTLAASLSHTRDSTRRVVGELGVERVAGDATLRAALRSDGTFASAVETTLRAASARFLVSLQANPFVGSYAWGFSLQLFR